MIGEIWFQGFNVENFGWSHLIHKCIRARYPNFKKLDNIVAFVQEGLYQMIQPTFSRLRFGKRPERRNSNEKVEVPLLGYD
jgi:hypothetical protein